MSSKKSLLFPGILILLTVALILAMGRKEPQVPCAENPCEKLPNCCLPKSNSTTEEPLNPHKPITNFILQI